MSVASELAAVAPRGAAGLNWKVLSVGLVAIMVEGYDTQVIGYVAPVISAEWNLAPGAFRNTFSFGLLGLALGCMFIAPLADRMGRKWIILGSTLAYGVLVLVTAFAESLTALFWLRFLTGLGLGGALPNIAATVAEGHPPRLRATAVAILFCGFAAGSFLCSFMTWLLLPIYGWPSVFLFGGAASLLMLPLLALTLSAARVAKTEHAAESHDAIPAAALFRDGRARFTIAMWIVFFMGLMDIYLLASWLPTTISAQGISIEVAAIITGIMQIGGIVGSLFIGPLVDRYGPNRVLAAAYFFAALCIAVIGIAGNSVLLTTVAVFGAGFGIVGGQGGNNGIATKIYPARMRAAGIGWALGVGRAGSIIGPWIAGYLLATQVEIRTIFLFSAVPAVCAALVYLTMGRPPAVEEHDA